jgi:rhodanese-related sulfurtransferase
MRNKHLSLYTIIITTVLLLAMCLTASAASVALMSTDELKSRLGDADLVVLDVRAGRDWHNSDKKIAGSERVKPGGANQWVINYPKDKEIVLYCA